MHIFGPKISEAGGYLKTKVEISLSQIHFRLALQRRPKRLSHTFTVTPNLKETTMPLCQTPGTFPAVVTPVENISSEDLELEHFTALHTMRSLSLIHI